MCKLRTDRKFWQNYYDPQRISTRSVFTVGIVVVVGLPSNELLAKSTASDSTSIELCLLCGCLGTLLMNTLGALVRSEMYCVVLRIPAQGFAV